MHTAGGEQGAAGQANRAPLAAAASTRRRGTAGVGRTGMAAHLTLPPHDIDRARMCIVWFSLDAWRPLAL